MSHKFANVLFRFVIYSLGIVSLLSIAAIFIIIFIKGWAVINWQFLTDVPSGSPLGTAGGIFPAILGTASLGIISVIIGGGIGVMSSIWVVFYGKNRPVSKLISWITYFLTGIPSIMFGLLGYIILILMLGFNRSLLCAGITVSAMIAPFVFIRVTKILKEHAPNDYKHSLALGISKEYSIIKIVIPASTEDILNTLFVSMAYGIGAVPPILFTGVVIFSELPVSLRKPFMSLPYHIYMLVSNGLSFEYAYGTVIVMLGLLIILHFINKLLIYILKKMR